MQVLKTDKMELNCNQLLSMHATTNFQYNDVIMNKFIIIVDLFECFIAF